MTTDTEQPPDVTDLPTVELSDEERERMAVAHGLRLLADLVDVGEVSIPYDGTRSPLHIYTYNEDDFRRAVRALPGERHKSMGTAIERVTVEAELDGIKVKVYGPPGSCTRRQVGTKLVTKEVAVETEEVTEEEPIYEWDCPPILDEGGDDGEDRG